MFTYKPALEQARRIIERQKTALAGKAVLERQNERLQEDLRELREKTERLETAYAAEQRRGLEAVGNLLAANDTLRAELEAAQKFIRQPEVHMLHVDYLQQERQRATRKAAEQKALEQEREEARRREEQECQARELERHRQEEEHRRAREPKRIRRGLGMGR